ncbi:MAG: OsmC family protein [Desulfatitalea sp.]|jgi:uncharacterized OsmC-like protein|nr:OsmC family protein [Desulfatitalea sp.]
MAAVAANKGFRLEKAEVRITTRIAATKPWCTDFDIHLDLDDTLDQRARTILSRCAAMCEVHKMLSGEMRFNYCLNP